MAKKKQQKKNGSEAMAILLDFMKKNPNAEYADARKELEAKGYKIYPINWGRAMKLLGRTAPKTASAKKKATKKKAPVGKKAARTARKKTARKKPKIVVTSRTQRLGVTQSPRIRVDASQVSQWQQLVQSLNAGGKLVLQFDGEGWILTTG